MTMLEGNQRGGAKNLAQHLVKDENDHVEIHEIRGFASDNLMGALNEAYAVSRGTKCKQFLYSLSVNPPPEKHVSIAEFEQTINRAEKTLGLEGQPRAIVFHEKAGLDGTVRRHAHVVWSRIDIAEMKAVHMSHDHSKLFDLSREIFIERGWKMPRGFGKKSERDYRNFSRAEWEQAKRTGKDPRAVKTAITDAWAISDSKAGFKNALKERGYVLARGDRGRFVAVDIFNEVYPIAQRTKMRVAKLRARLGDESDLPSVDQARRQIAKDMTPTIRRMKAEVSASVNKQQAAISREREQLVKRQREERKTLKEQQLKRSQQEAVDRQSRFRRGVKGLWDRMRGEHARIRKLNEQEAKQAQRRDRKEQENLITEQLSERRMHQQHAKAMSSKHHDQIRAIERDLGRYHDRQPIMPGRGYGR